MRLPPDVDQTIELPCGPAGPLRQRIFRSEYNPRKARMRTQLPAILVSTLLSSAIAGCQAVPRHELDEGYASLEQRQFELALASADGYLREQPTGPASAQALYLRGRALEQRPKRDENQARADLGSARFAYESALARSPDRELEAYVRTSLGNVCYWLGDYIAAQREWDEAYRRLDNEDVRSWVLYRIGLCQQRRGHWEQADQTFAVVAQRYPGTEPASRALAHTGARGYYVQVAAYRSGEAADKLVSELRRDGHPALRQDDAQRGLFLVRIGPLSDHAQALEVRRRVAGRHPDALIVP
jgi:outer membrane protein assembly factor BamD (BamD/ComL family)